MTMKLEDFTEEFIPEKLTELSIKTLREIENGILEVPEEGFEAPNVNGGSEDFVGLPESFDGRVFEVRPLPKRVNVVAVDVSCKRIGIIREGLVCAFRGTIVWRDEYAYRYMRYGPYIFYLGGKPLERLEDSHIGYDENPLSLVGRLQNFFERELQRHVCRMVKNSIILFDGSLSVISGNNGWNSRRLIETLRVARLNGNRVIAIAKDSKLLPSRRKLLNLAALKAEPPYLIYIGEPSEIHARNFRSFGKVFIAKLSREGFEFRLDVDLDLSFNQILTTIGELLSSEILVQGYPETLRIAHILSALTPIEVLAIERFLAEKYGVTVKKVRNVRRMIFGPFGWKEETPA